MAKKSAISDKDWDLLRAEYISSSISIRELADKFSCSADALEARAGREQWTEQRRKMSAEVLERANQEIADKRVAELVKFNEEDLEIARAIRKQIRTHIEDSIQSNNLMKSDDIRKLASAAESAQKIGRLALGVSTNNNEVTGKDGSPLKSSLELVFLD
jgi:hypothetical protein